MEQLCGQLMPVSSASVGTTTKTEATMSEATMPVSAVETPSPGSVSAAAEMWWRGESTDPEYWRRKKPTIQSVQ